MIIQTSNWLTIKIKQMAARHLECSHTATDPEEASHWSDLTHPGLSLAVITLSNDHDIKGWLAQAQGIISSSSPLTTLTTHSHTELSDQQNIIWQKTRPNIIRSTNNGGKPILGTIVLTDTDTLGCSNVAVTRCGQSVMLCLHYAAMRGVECHKGQSATGTLSLLVTIWVASHH